MQHRNVVYLGKLIGKITNWVTYLSDAEKFPRYVLGGHCNHCAVVNAKNKTANINAKTSTKFNAKL